MKPSELIHRILADESLVEVGRKAIEDRLVEFRDSRLSCPLRGNGLVIREFDGQPSNIIRFGPETAITIALQAILERVVKDE